MSVTHWFGIDVSTSFHHQGGHILVAMFGSPVQSRLYKTKTEEFKNSRSTPASFSYNHVG